MTSISSQTLTKLITKGNIFTAIFFSPTTLQRLITSATSNTGSRLMTMIKNLSTGICENSLYAREQGVDWLLKDM